MSVRKAAALAVAQLGIAVFFIAGIARTVAGDASGWLVLAAAGLAAFARAIDIESWVLLIPGGLPGRAARAFGTEAAGLAIAIVFAERLLLGALACILVGHYLSGVAGTAIAGMEFTGHVRPEDLATLLAVGTIAVLWIRVRIGRDLDRDAMARAVWTAVAVLAVILVWSVITFVRSGIDPAALLSPLRVASLVQPSPLDTLVAFALCAVLMMTVIGGGEPLARAAADFPPPRLPALKRTGVLTVFFAISITTVTTFLVAALVPRGEQALYVNAPLAGLAQQLAGPAWTRDLAAIAVAAAALLFLVPVVHGTLRDTEQILHRLSTDGTLPRGLASLHTRFGTPARAVDLTVATMVLVMLAGGGRVTWLARAYGITVAAMVLLSVVSLIRLRITQPGPTAFKTALTIGLKGRELPVGLYAMALFLGTSLILLIFRGDVISVVTLALVGMLALWLIVRPSDVPAQGDTGYDSFDLLRTAELSVDEVEARPGNVLVPVRNPHALAHVAAALQTARDRDVVVMTVRLLDIDVGADTAGQTTPTAYERRLFADVVALAERIGRPIRLLIVPARDVVDAIVGTVIRLRSSDVYVGESSTLSGADQARLLGEAWERADKPEALDVRLVIHHRSGRADSFYLGAHPPSLTPGDLDLIHRLWLDAVKAVGPHVHHHDVVRAALTQMEQQLTGPNRNDAVAAIRETARPAEELAAVLRSRDYARLRDMLRNRAAGEVATLLTDLSLEDQVVVFRVLPRKDAAAVFEYLSHDAKEALLKAMAKEDVAELLNNMAPDERTMFLEELPAEATRQLLSLLTPAERAVAVTLLGYPERSVGRLMTPNYLAVREQWTVREVLDYVREHGQDSETLNVVYVADDQGALIDDVRIRELLLAPLDRRVAELMDRRFVSLKATDDQETAVAVFREYDRTALPVTDTAGMLIGIVTIDDVLDVAEATATREIQRIGGSEALDEPYMKIAMWRMIQKRAGWLTALFLGEMLTATAMGAFEEEISRAVVLALFVPLIISSGGNSGSQASTLVIRALALGEVTLHDWWHVMRREILAGLALGTILGGIGFMRISLWSAFSPIYGPHWLLVALTVAIALVGVVLWGTLSGSLLPFALKRLGFDPAASSAPFVATLVDVTGLVIYFSVALVILRGTLL
jgi:magnesium transporter